MKSKSKVLTSSFLSVLLASCSTANLAREKASFPAFCENGHARQQHVFIVAAYNGIPKGISVSSVKSLVRSSSETSDFIKDHFIQALLVYTYSEEKNAPLVQNGVLFEIFKKRFVHGWAPTLPHLAWVKQNKFAICEGASCDGMKYPESSTDIVEFDSQK